LEGPSAAVTFEDERFDISMSLPDDATTFDLVISMIEDIVVDEVAPTPEFQVRSALSLLRQSRDAAAGPSEARSEPNRKTKANQSRYLIWNKNVIESFGHNKRIGRYRSAV